MKRKTLGLGIAAIAVGMLSTSAFALTVFGNNSQKGSLLIYPRINTSGSTDTLVTLTNDSSLAVRLKCYYATSDPVDTPNAAPASALRGLKHFEDFTIDLTHNQPVAWWAKTGSAYSDSQRFAGFVAPPFGRPFPDGTTRTIGDLKCWAVTDDGATEKSHNHLFGTASVFFAGGQAYEYTAWAFQAIAPAEAALGSPGVLNLDNVEYDACPNILLGNFLAFVPPNTNVTRVTLASCNQDLRQAYTPTITKLTWTFFNQDEAARTGTHFCADSWFEGFFPIAANWPFAQLTGLGTEVGYFRIETTADTQICGPSAVTSAYVGVIEQSQGAGNFHGTNLTGRGPAIGKILYDVSPPDSSRPSL